MHRVCDEEVDGCLNRTRVTCLQSIQSGFTAWIEQLRVPSVKLGACRAPTLALFKAAAAVPERLVYAFV
jgi:hypothetical protein